MGCLCGKLHSLQGRGPVYPKYSSKSTVVQKVFVMENHGTSLWPVPSLSKEQAPLLWKTPSLTPNNQVTNYDLKHQTSNLKSCILQVVIVPTLCFRKTTRTLMPRPEACTDPRDPLLLMFQLHPTSQKAACRFNSVSTSIPSWSCCWDGSCSGVLNAYDGSSAHSEPENHTEFLRSDKV